MAASCQQKVSEAVGACLLGKLTSTDVAAGVELVTLHGNAERVDVSVEGGLNKLKMVNKMAQALKPARLNTMTCKAVPLHNVHPR